MPEFDHHPDPVSLHDCETCQDRGIEVESREYCQVCYRGKRRKNIDAFAEKLRGLPFKDAMWIVAHSTINTERAIAAAELALLKSKLLQKERELAEVRKDADRYRWMRDKTIVVSWSYQDESGNIIRCVSSEVRMDERIDFAAASVAQANKEQGNG